MGRIKSEQLLALGEQLSRARKSRGITLEELAGKISISKGNLSEIERGKRDPRYSTLLAIAAGLGTDVSNLLFADPKSRSLYAVSRKNSKPNNGGTRSAKRKTGK